MQWYSQSEVSHIDVVLLAGKMQRKLSEPMQKLKYNVTIINSVS